MAASSAEALVICQTTSGIYTYKAVAPSEQPVITHETKPVHCMKVSSDGNLLAWATETNLNVFSFPDDKVVLNFPWENPATSAYVAISPLGNFVAAWVPQTAGLQQNARIWEISTGTLVAKFEVRKSTYWEPQWSADEKICIRKHHDELHCYADNKFGNLALRVCQRKVNDFSIAGRGDQIMVATLEKGDTTKCQADFVRIFKYPTILTSHLAVTSFFDCQSWNLRWNCSGTALLVLKTAEQSKTSYLGDRSLFFLTTATSPTLAPNNSCLMSCDKKGPVSDAVWSPSGKEFCVIYGTQPARAVLYGLRLEKLMDFGEGARNIALFNQQGTKLCLGGFGTIRGKLQIWNLTTKELFLDTQDAQACDFEWCPDGERYLTTITSPKLNVMNRFWIYTSLGGHLLGKSIDYGGALRAAIWRPVPSGIYTAEAARPVPLPAAAQPVQPSKQAYVPPHKSYGIPGLAPVDRPKSSAKPAAAKLGAQAKTSGDDVDKQLKKLYKKKDEIDALKVKQNSGGTLERNQIEKIGTEKDLLQKIEELETALGQQRLQ